MDNLGQFWAIFGIFWQFLDNFWTLQYYCARLPQQPYFPHCASVGRSDISICRSAETKCKFPFKHDGKTYQKCTKVSVFEKCKNCVDEDFFWCATQIDQFGHMKMWGKCDTSTCDLSSGIFRVFCEF